jgi:hypothetical protein
MDLLLNGYKLFFAIGITAVPLVVRDIPPNGF